MRVFAILMFLLVTGGTLSSPQTATASPDAIQSNQPASPPASAANALGQPTDIAPQNCAPSYPPIAVRLNQQGTTVLIVHVTPKGTVADVTVKNSSGHDALDSAAVKCAQTWTYRPATQNGKPVEAYVERTIRWSLDGGISPLPIPFRPPDPPAGWQREGASPYVGGILVSYKLSQAPAAEQYLSAAAYSNLSDLSDFVARNDANLQSIKNLHLRREERTTLCNGDPASEIEYSQSGLLSADSARILDVEQVRTVKNGWAYVSTYIRPADIPKRPDAEQWIHMFCESRR